VVKVEIQVLKRANMVVELVLIGLQKMDHPKCGEVPLHFLSQSQLEKSDKVFFFVQIKCLFFFSKSKKVMASSFFNFGEKDFLAKVALFETDGGQQGGYDRVTGFRGRVKRVTACIAAFVHMGLGSGGIDLLYLPVSDGVGARKETGFRGLGAVSGNG
jgi:hypothetical protein